MSLASPESQLCIVAATRTETGLIIDYLFNQEDLSRVKGTLSGMDVESGTWRNRRVVVIRTGVGKVNAAMGTQSVVDAYKPDLVIHIGAAAGLDETLKPGEVVIPWGTIEWDLDLSAIYPKTNNEHTVPLPDGIESYPAGSIIATGDTFIVDQGLASSIGVETHAICLDMESAAIAAVCSRNTVPCLIIKGITDRANNTSPDDLQQNYHQAITGALQAFDKLNLWN